MSNSLPAGERPPLPRPLRGLVVVWLCVVEPLWLALEAQGALPRLASFGAPAWTLLAARSAVVVLGFVAGRLLWFGDARGLSLAAGWAVLSIGAALLAATTPYFPENRPPSLKRLVLGATLVCYALAGAGLWRAAWRGR
jgi:hypothetical protein